MRIGVAREIKPQEYRVALTPAGALELVQRGHEVIVETGAGVGSGFADEAYAAVGARLADVDEVWASAELLLKVKEPIEPEYARLREGLTLFTYLHIAADEPLTRALLDSGITAIAYETVETADRRLPLLAPMSEVAGRLAPQMGAWALEKAHGGRGILLGGVPGVPPAKVVVLGGGVVGLNSAIIALGMQADVWVLDKSVDRMRDLEIALDGRVTLAMSNRLQIEEVLADADMVIGAVLVPGRARAEARDARDARADATRRRARRRGDRPGRLLRDVARDDARRPDLRGRRDRPLLRREHARRRAGHVDEGLDERHAAVRRGDREPGDGTGDRRRPGARTGVNALGGKLTYEAVAEAHGLPFTPLEDAEPRRSSSDAALRPARALPSRSSRARS